MPRQGHFYYVNRDTMESCRQPPRGGRLTVVA